MITYTYIFNPTSQPMPHALLRQKVRRWASRRAYGISFQVLQDRVVAHLDAPHSGEHNRSVKSLAAIIYRTVEKYWFDNNLCH